MEDRAATKDGSAHTDAGLMSVRFVPWESEAPAEPFARIAETALATTTRSLFLR